MDENGEFKNLNRTLESFEKSSVKSKDYIKFLIGLSTGTLVFSGALVKEFIKAPQYQFILIIAWTCLFLSIILGVWILPAGDRFQSLIESFTRILAESPEKVKAIHEKKLQHYYLRDWIKKILPSNLESDERMKEFYKSLETAPLKGLKEVFDKLPGDITVLKELKKEFVKFLFLIRIEEQASYAPNVLKSLRRTAWQLIYFEKVMRYTFFIGMFAILIFSITNL